MKKTTLFSFFFLFSFFLVNAQFSILTNIGRLQEDDLIKTNTLDPSGASLAFKIKNESDSPISVRLKVIAIGNTDGDKFELCFGGDCHHAIRAGLVYPTGNQAYYTIPSFGLFDLGENRLWNKKEIESSESELVYEFEFQQIDPITENVLNSLRFTYAYSNVEEAPSSRKEVEVQIQKTIIRDGTLLINAKEPVSVKIYNLIGREVKSMSLGLGMTSIDISGLSSQIYIVRFQDQQGIIKTQKIVVD